ncbi:hypothetical protein RI030_07860 [Aphanizomenon flos-aquae NRERC-008]|uniref:Uncharacterized protein n=1 Tax=Aphanizomenon flos-aquae FACHB-1249 TaxID=2692889 RepID=A0ABR8ITK4_APHFL|nr:MULTISPECIES: hypothetical protein [Aphanizomenon]MCE2905672.1 hypothetical protein [Anabaena sp. CoA2_C59]MDJ0506811.1 hypothetical protein [Nostocales cyanobacterium LE14-WE12]MBD2392426.1 hypothetical protein [Aphanizomenon flos-aquae FACHB-1171]MBD2558649.1 hypothetical protein [Aphanizomenon flos-aquae FACHB-1290]MBD2632234.1 hypothetical protein [Aphanizomenon sp. FACHB-1399]
MNNNQNVAAAINLLFNPTSLQEAIQIEDETDCDVIAGLDWGLAIPALLQNPGMFGRMTQLRVSLNRELRLLLKEWNLGIAEKTAVEVAQKRLIQRLQLPQPVALSALQDILKQDELYNVEEFISNRDVLKSLLSILLLASDWEEIAVSAVKSVQEQIFYQLGINQISV